MSTTVAQPNTDEVCRIPMSTSFPVDLFEETLKLTRQVKEKKVSHIAKQLFSLYEGIMVSLHSLSISLVTKRGYNIKNSDFSRTSENKLLTSSYIKTISSLALPFCTLNVIGATPGMLEATILL